MQGEQDDYRQNKKGTRVIALQQLACGEQIGMMYSHRERILFLFQAIALHVERGILQGTTS
jgi:hypothetical protein